MLPSYSIGDVVWRATADVHEHRVVCPDCAGSSRLRVILGDDTEVSIECENCKRGFERASGSVIEWVHSPRAVRATISKIRMENDTIEYGSSDSYYLAPENVFQTETDAMARAEELAADWAAQERARIYRKEKDHRSWGWNATYHRRAIKEANRQLAYHTAALSWASKKAKEAPVITETTESST